MTPHGLLVAWRRHMHEARIDFAKETALPLALMAQLYDIERRAVDYTAKQRYELRQQDSVMILARLRQWLDGPIAGDALPRASWARRSITCATTGSRCKSSLWMAACRSITTRLKLP
ncbi:MAG: transposase [Pirellulaceae bacterium]